MEETEENWNCHNETIEARLRNKMGALFSLPDSVIAFEDTNSDKIKEIMIRQAKQASKSRIVAKKMLLSIESDRDKSTLQAQIDVLSEHIEHPNNPGYRRSDILLKIKELKKKLK